MKSLDGSRAFGPITDSRAFGHERGPRAFGHGNGSHAFGHDGSPHAIGHGNTHTNNSSRTLGYDRDSRAFGRGHTQTNKSNHLYNLVDQAKDKRRLTPVLITKTRQIQNTTTTAQYMIALCDSGSTTTLINQRVLPKGIKMHLTGKTRVNTINGTFDICQHVSLRDINFPEFEHGMRIAEIKAYVFDSDCRYDIILGRDALSMIGLDLSFNEKCIKWKNATVPFKDAEQLPTDKLLLEQELSDIDLFLNTTKEIKERKYEKVTADQVADKQTHLTAQQKEEFEQILRKHEQIFDGKLGRYPHKKVHINLINGTQQQPIFKKSYPIPYQHYDVFKNELDALERDGVLEKCSESEWAFPTFIVPKKDGRVRWVSDFRELNKLIIRKQFPIPKIQDIMNRRGRYTFFTKIDVSMQYYCFELDEESSKLFTINTPFGLYRYKQLPMGMKISGDIAQAAMSFALRDLNVECYMDDSGIWTNGTFSEHMRLVDEVLLHLSQNGLKCNPLKCDWAVQETNFLGHWMTPSGIKPWKKKINPILKMDRPRNTTELRSFIGAVNFYRSLWPRRAHVLAPLSTLTGTKTFKWTDEQDKAFKEMKAILAADAINAYPNYDIQFELYADSSDYQVDAAIIQQGRPIAYFSKKLNAAQKNYNTMEKELLALVLTLKEYERMLRGARIIAYTDHKNLTFKTFSIQRILRWQLFLDEFDLDLQYIEGKKNVLADCFSRLPIMDSSAAVGNGKRKRNGRTINFNELQVPKDNDTIHDETFYLEDNTDVVECLLNLLQLHEMPNPITAQNIAHHQQTDDQLHANATQHPNRYPIKVIGRVPIITYIKNAANPGQWKICLPDSLINDVITWYHRVLGHPGSQRLYLSISARFTATNLRRRIDEYKCPDNCSQWALCFYTFEKHSSRSC